MATKDFFRACPRGIEWLLINHLEILKEEERKSKLGEGESQAFTGFNTD